MNNSTFTFNSRKIKLSDSIKVEALAALVTDSSQLEYFDSKDEVTTELENAVSVKRKQQVVEIPVITLDDILAADSEVSAFILNSLLEKSIFELVRTNFDKAVNGDLGAWSVTLEELKTHLTPAATTGSGAKVTKKAIKAIAESFAAWLKTQGKKPKAVALQLELALNAFGVNAMMAYESNMVEAIANNFLAFADSYEGEEAEALELLLANIGLAVANTESLGADDL